MDSYTKSLLVLKSWFLRRLFVTLAVLFFVGCNTVPIAREKTQSQASEIVAVLHSHGISAFLDKETGGGKGKYTVEVKKGFASQAIAVLYEKGLLSDEPRLTLTDLISQHGIMPNSREMETLRVHRAMAIEIEDLLNNHPAVLSAKVVVPSEFENNGVEANAAVVIQEREGQSINVEEIKEIVGRVVPGISKEGVHVSVHKGLSPDAISGTEGATHQGGRVIRIPLSPFLFKWKVAEDDYNGLAFTLFLGLAVVFLIGGILGYFYGTFKQSRYQGVTYPEVGTKTNKIDVDNRNQELLE